ncbi:hypothetical protein KQX54_002840 [Cotesia glomerata]|uniref:Uncharacterized protein n=1 Tax=Cotesia glomerata TaxID=32391 RepID=A0AAV7IBG2_COTGL|nr:hypothetical protein KQX54_002840 [Cotesia glomerata]
MTAISFTSSSFALMAPWPPPSPLTGLPNLGGDPALTLFLKTPISYPSYEQPRRYEQQTRATRSRGLEVAVGFFCGFRWASGSLWLT